MQFRAEGVPKPKFETFLILVFDKLTLLFHGIVLRDRKPIAQQAFGIALVVGIGDALGIQRNNGRTSDPPRMHELQPQCTNCDSVIVGSAVPLRPMGLRSLTAPVVARWSRF
jgi:hypothetical protein